MWTPGGHVDDSSLSMFSPGYHPDQPIPFSHKLHAGKRAIPCQFCHDAARRSQTAKIPTVETCMGCHRYVNTDVPVIQKIKEHFDKNEPIKWTKVHDLPDYVRFSHKVHVLAKDENGNPLLGKDNDAVCKACHGPVETMDTAEQQFSMQMGQCVECHTRVRVPAKNGKPAITYAPVTCNTCHY